jgi:hypothetical protein
MIVVGALRDACRSIQFTRRKCDDRECPMDRGKGRKRGGLTGKYK